MDQRPRILLVDDDLDELELLEATLAPLGVATTKANGGAEALALVDQAPFSVAVLDLMMPGLNGFEVAALLRERENGRGMPILILSGYDARAARRLPGWSFVQGRVDYLEKPFSGEVLRWRVAAAYSPTSKRSAGLAPRR